MCIDTARKKRKKSGQTLPFLEAGRVASWRGGRVEGDGKGHGWGNWAEGSGEVVKLVK